MPTLSQAFILSFIASIVQSEITEDFSTNDNGPFLPRADCCMAVGYYNGVITLIGGDDLGTDTSSAVIEYDIDTETFTQSLNALPAHVGAGQYNHFWVQNGVNVFIINPAGTALQVYDLSTKTLADNWRNTFIPARVYNQACIAFAHSVLYIMGGGTGTFVLLNTVQRYDIDSSRWLATKSLLQHRREPSCVYSPPNDALYAIGGWNNVGGSHTLTSVEYVTISEIETGPFQYTLNGLNNDAGLAAMSSVLDGTDIYILGGSVRVSLSTYVFQDSIHVLDTTTNLIHLSPHKLAYAVAYTTGVLADNAIYLFGGELINEGEMSNQLQFYELARSTSISITTTLYGGTNTGISMTTSQATSISTLSSHSDAAGDPSREPIWIPIVIGVDTALVVVCMCLAYYLYQKHCIDSKQMQEHQNPKNRLNIPNQNPIIVPDHSSMEMAPIHLATTLPPRPQQPSLLTYKHYLQWTGEEFLHWIMRLNSGRYMCYVQIMKVKFVEHGICGAMIPYWNDEWWMKLGVSGQIDRFELMNAVHNLVGRGEEDEEEEDEEEEEKKDDDVSDFEQEEEGNNGDSVGVYMNLTQVTKRQQRETTTESPSFTSNSVVPPVKQLYSTGDRSQVDQREEKTILQTQGYIAEDEFVVDDDDDCDDDAIICLDGNSRR